MNTRSPNGWRKLIAAVSAVVALVFTGVGFTIGHFQARSEMAEGYVSIERHNAAIQRIELGVREVKDSIDILIALHMQERIP